MNKTESESIRLIDEIKAQKLNENVNVFIAPTFVNLASAVKATKDSGIEVAAQNMHQSSSGAYTGEISADASRHWCETCDIRSFRTSCLLWRNR